MDQNETVEFHGECPVCGHEPPVVFLVSCPECDRCGASLIKNEPEPRK